MVEYLRLRLPMTIFYSNLSTISPKPRLGAFEVSIRRYGSDKSQLLYSKLSKTKFPIDKVFLIDMKHFVHRRLSFKIFKNANRNLLRKYQL
jgi:hypothetical protein